jgi:hypothetical protein
MTIRYQFYENEKLIIQKYSGIFSIEQYIRFSGFIGKELSSKVITKVLNDFRDLKIAELDDEMPDDFNEEIERISEIRKNFNSKLRINNEIMVVFWVDKPLPTVVAHLFINNFSNMNYFYCSTGAKAIELLKLSPQFGNLNRILQNLEHTFHVE